MAASRSEVRAGFSLPHKVVLLENDADGFEVAIDKITFRLSAILASLSTGAVLLAINLAVQLSGE